MSRSPLGLSDGRGGQLSCSCSGHDTCGGGGTAGHCGCTPKTCAALAPACGALDDGCGNSLSCSCTFVDDSLDAGNIDTTRTTATSGSGVAEVGPAFALSQYLGDGGEGALAYASDAGGASTVIVYGP